MTSTYFFMKTQIIFAFRRDVKSSVQRLGQRVKYASCTALVVRPVAKIVHTRVSHRYVAATVSYNSWRSDRNALAASDVRL